jgi:hypothetical protein
LDWNDSNLNTATPDQRNTRDWAIANALSSVKARIKADNAIRVDAYNKAFDEYSFIRFNHPDLAVTAPVPALAEVVVFNDGWPEAADGNEHVCPMKVYAPPATYRPSKKTEDGGLMGAIVAEGSVSGNPTISTVPVYEKSTDSAGHLWMRIL